MIMMREFFTGVDNFREQSRIAAGLLRSLRACRRTPSNPYCLPEPHVLSGRTMVH
ncbi:MAG: hypothetical protein MZV70_37205 [Desulfobacterales bacterium]|nr:hypothetical protein [Desulfobacterales bacterium]